MSQCLNPTCLHQNPQGTNFCENCGSKILLDDRYRPIKFLGEGGFGRTFQAVDEKRLNTPCVIKQFLPQQAGSAALAKATELFQQEAKRLQELGKHPQIPDLEAFFPQDGRLYLVQDFIDGQNLLEEFKNQGKLKEPQIRIILTELLPVLQFIHDNQVIHRDIKPENIIRSKTGQLFLIDFGVSKETSGTILTRVGTITGTPGYAPPEQFRGMVYHNSDLYSLAVTCVRLLTGHFQEADGADKLFDTRKMEWQWQKYVSLSQELTTVLETMLQVIPAKRYQSATEVLAVLTNQKTIVISSPINPPKPPANINVNINLQSSFQENLGNGVFLEMIAIPGGTFWMGSPENEAERSSHESPQHQVTVPSFFMGKYPLTQAQYQAIIGDNPSGFKGNNRPVETVSWDDAVTFCQKLSQRTGKNYRLPSEAEWEYACRAGTNTPFYFGDNITPDLVNYDGNYPYKSAPKGKYRQQTTDVGAFPPNAFGLYDMHGNVWEWCEDDWHENYINAPTDGSAWNSRSGDNIRLLRGGSWSFIARICRSASRNRLSRGNRFNIYGFRVVASFRTL
ncbi:bifunctional serine/threonine-protein kinase/formylglycine-generating enzyme family protein [Dolichospermum circinale]|uniref:bifunctional serine/threonine-protein kinase/formylglycine-generating enzyme family protein n=1 Tax=Dolichospermum circinale TaxID=109265 RepID=UPI00232C0B8E|nr:SUMF1/EgtB/PvdO family nonheme iron enzyme [Dolichospermum circinale]MDB9456258.1 SUMF1/EgtB/PvdO family nonheme iron enzyme [Dolichospermum circinale CS-541/06]MDB9464755.1 SUMF1/EgtB/PvdO family nonheme iron enzyme [Dolichospermum circinale CS-541/04]MDB9546697.1 SUMF1/EgtB/PvdO family nonheme iron enzyme [Dolichospermum circinale CS-1031]